MCHISLSAQTDHDTTRVDLNNLEIVTEEAVNNYDKPLSALHLDYISDKDSIKFDVPESMMLNIDSLMNN